MQVNEITLVPNIGARSEVVAMTVASAQSSIFSTTAETYVNVTPDATCFFRMGVNPTALSNGTDQILLGSNMYRIGPVPAGYRFALIVASGAGNAYITKEN